MQDSPQWRITASRKWSAISAFLKNKRDDILNQHPEIKDLDKNARRNELLRWARQLFAQEPLSVQANYFSMGTEVEDNPPESLQSRKRLRRKTRLDGGESSCAGVQASGVQASGVQASGSLSSALPICGAVLQTPTRSGSCASRAAPCAGLARGVQAVEQAIAADVSVLVPKSPHQPVIPAGNQGSA